MIILVVGGSKSGKSMLSQRIAKYLEEADGNLFYIATMKPYDNEDMSRIDNHIKEREGFDFITIEKNVNIEELGINFKSLDTVMLDSITALVTNEMFKDGDFINEVHDKILDGLMKVKDIPKNMVIVSDYLFSDSIKYDDYTDNFRKELGNLNISIAKFSDVVIESSFSNIIIHKGKEKVGFLNEKFI